MSKKKKAFFHTLRNRKFRSDLSRAQDKADELYKGKSNTVICTYCGKLLPKSEATFCYDIEHDTAIFSHEECWNENNTVCEGPIVACNDNQ